MKILPSLTKPASRRALGTSFKVGVFGTTGSGKSAFCNALIDRVAVRESDIAHVARRVQIIDSAPGLNNISLYVCPGIGATPEQDAAYEKIYQEIVGAASCLGASQRADHSDDGDSNEQDKQ